MRGLIESLEFFIGEAKADLKPQAVVLMGLPAAGKSTFIRKGYLNKYVSNFKAPKVENSDVQVKRTQRDYASRVWEVLSATKNRDEYDQAVKELAYKSNTGKMKRIKSGWEGFQAMRNSTDFFRGEYKHFFATWFDLRDMAKDETDKMFKDKITRVGDGFVMDTVAAKPAKVLSKLAKTKAMGMTNSLFYLEVDPKLSIIRDIYRGKTEGRTVGEGVIMNYASQMDGAFDVYQKDARDPDGVIDRLYRFRWEQAGEDAVLGRWILVSKYRADVIRELALKRAKSKEPRKVKTAASRVA